MTESSEKQRQNVVKYLSGLSSDYELRLARKIGTQSVQGARHPFQNEIARGLLLRLAIQGKMPIDYFIDDSDWGFYNLNNRELFQNAVRRGVETRLVFPYSIPDEEKEPLLELMSQNAGLDIREIGLPRDKEIINFLIVGDSLIWRTTQHASFRGKEFDEASPEIVASVYFNPGEEDLRDTKDIFNLAFEKGKPIK